MLNQEFQFNLGSAMQAAIGNASMILLLWEGEQDFSQHFFTVLRVDQSAPARQDDAPSVAPMGLN